MLFERKKTVLLWICKSCADERGYFRHANEPVITLEARCSCCNHGTYVFCLQQLRHVSDDLKKPRYRR